MPLGTHFDPERPRGQQSVPCYRQGDAEGWTVTDAGLDAARQIRRYAAGDIDHWNRLKPTIGRFAKDEMKAAQRLERATTIWLRHFGDPGQRIIRKMPLELAGELDAVWRAMVLA